MLYFSAVCIGLSEFHCKFEDSLVLSAVWCLACLHCRLFLTLCEIIKRQTEGKHSPSGVQVTGAALTLAELFEDFVTGSHLADLPEDCDGATAMELGLDTKRCTSEVRTHVWRVMMEAGKARNVPCIG